MYQISPIISEDITSPSRGLSVVDVYDIAAGIGKEFETIIDAYGPQAVTELMPKVINILEHLEALAGKNQKEDAELQELRFAVKQLQQDKSAKAEERERYEKELEQIEDSWRKETNDLMQTVSRLQEDKRRLQAMLQEHEGHTSKLMQAEEEEQSMMTKMKETVDKQREELRSSKRELSHKTAEFEAVQAQCERLAKLNAEYRRKSSLTQRQSKALIHDKAELQAQLHDKDQQLDQFKHLKHQDSQEGATVTPLSDAELTKMIDKLQREGKMVVDLADPNRPRFTINELQDVLQERNELKTRLIEVEEELLQFKGGPLDTDLIASRLEEHSIENTQSLQEELTAEAFPTPARTGDTENSETVIHSIVTGSSRHNSQSENDAVGAEDDEDPPVQGPINKEPFEKLYPDFKEDGGIRKLFQRFLDKLPVNID